MVVLEALQRLTNCFIYGYNCFSEERVEDEASSSEATSDKRIPEVPSIKEKMAELKASRQELEADELNRRFEIELCLTKETPLTALSEDQLLNRYLHLH